MNKFREIITYFGPNGPVNPILTGYVVGAIIATMVILIHSAFFT